MINKNLYKLILKVEKNFQPLVLLLYNSNHQKILKIEKKFQSLISIDDVQTMKTKQQELNLSTS